MKIFISSFDAGKNVLHFLREKLGVSGRVLKKAINQGALRLNGVVERFSSVTLKKGDRLTFDQSKIKKKREFSLTILEEKEECIFCLKPSGLATDQEVFAKLLRQRVYLVHRLDKDTSGLILVATTQKMQKKLEILFKKREVHKIYIALLQGNVQKGSGVIHNRLIRKKIYQGQSIWGSTKSSKGVRAVTYWKCLKKGKNKSLVQCEPETGRTHQLRVHFGEMGHPILGDYQYGRFADFPKEVDRLCLHAYSLAFIHPNIGEKIEIKAPIPHFFHF